MKRKLLPAVLAALFLYFINPAAALAENIDPAATLLESATASSLDDGTIPEGNEAPAEENSRLILLTWKDDPESVRYEVEIFRGLPENLDRNSVLEDHLYDNQRIYSNKVLVDLSQFPEGDGPL